MTKPGKNNAETTKVDLVPDSMTHHSALDGLLENLRVRGHLLLHGLHSPPWAAQVPTAATLAKRMRLGDGWRIVPFHIVLEGAATLHAADGASFPLGAGDLVICAGGAPHRISQGDHAETHDFEDLLAAAEGTCRLGFDSQTQGRTEMVCGAFAVRDEPLNPLLASLPPVLLLTRNHDPQAGMLAEVIRLMSTELARTAPNRFAMSRLIEIVCVAALRAHAQSDRDHRPGWLRASADLRIGPALDAIHRDPGSPWTITALATFAALSPSRFAGRFRDVMGKSVMSYVTDQRMILACRWLREGAVDMSGIAFRVGYEDPAAFSRAFKARLGLSPARWRALNRAAND